MKILAASDFHILNDCPWKELERYLSDVDIVAIAGDLIDRNMPDQISIARAFLKWCHEDRQKGIEFVVVAGNNDGWSHGTHNPFVGLPPDDNVHWLEDSGATVKGLRFWGTPWIKDKNTEDQFARPEAVLRRRFSLIEDGVDVLVSHSTPHIENSHISGSRKDHKGCDSLAEAIVSKKPKIVFCGHIHAGQHEPEKLGDSIVLNVSLYKDKKIRYRPRMVEVVCAGNGRPVFKFSKKDDMKIHRRALKCCDSIDSFL